MKSLGLIILVLGFSLGTLADSGNKFTVTAKGMTCAACVKAVEGKIAEQLSDEQKKCVKAEVTTNKVDVDVAQCKLKPGEEAKVREKIEAAIKAAKYEVVKKS